MKHHYRLCLPVKICLTITTDSAISNEEAIQRGKSLLAQAVDKHDGIPVAVRGANPDANHHPDPSAIIYPELPGEPSPDFRPSVEDDWSE